MPVERILHPRAGDSNKVNRLDDFQYRVWTQYMLCADDFGVMPFSAPMLQGANRRLDSEPREVVQAAFQAVADIKLVLTFNHQGRPYVCDPTWQKWQKIRYPRKPEHPCPPIDTIALFNRETFELFRDCHDNFPETFPKNLVPPAPGRARNANANANAKREEGNGGKPHPIREALTLFDQLFRAKFSKPASISGGKDSATMKRLLERYGGAEVTSSIHAFFNSSDRFIQQSGYSVGAFHGCFGKLITLHPPAKQAAEELRENWLTDCKQKHGGACDGTRAHYMQCQIDGARGKKETL